MGAARQDIGRPKDAQGAFKSALRLNQGNVIAAHSLSALFITEGQNSAGFRLLKRLIVLKPNCAEHITRYREALDQSDQAGRALYLALRELVIDPLCASARVMLARYNLLAKQYTQAIFHTVRAAVVEPENLDALINLALSEEPRGRIQAMVDQLARVCVLEPRSTRYAYWHHLALPPIPGSKMDINRWRERFQKGLKALQAREEVISDPITVVTAPYFIFAYHGLDNRAPIEALSRLLRAKSPGLEHRAPQIDHWRHPDLDRQKIKLGILSRFSAATPLDSFIAVSSAISTKAVSRSW